MTATASDPRPGAVGRAPSGTSGGSQPDPVLIELAPSVAERNLQARSSNRVYQAAGNQYIYHREPAAPAAVSNTLPRDTPAFTGRHHELRRLVDTVTGLLDKAEMIPVYAIDGMAGVGKSTLAVHAGHLLAHRFPDGQFFIDLHAHSAGHGPVRPADALFELLCADGMEAGQIPSDLDTRAGMWRGRMAGRRALIILDNADGREQIEYLLPGAAGCLVMITSRRRLTGLSALHAAVPLPLGTLPAGHAVELFSTVAGRPLSGAEAEAAENLVTLCGHLPLAICLLAAKLRPEPRWRVAELVQDLAHPHHRLAQMHAEDIGVRAAFDLSYERLPAGRRRFFRRLGLHPGADLDRWAAAALDGISPVQAERQLDALYHDHLLDQPVRGRYRMHDLIRDYARSRVDNDPARDRSDAVTRLLDYYQQTARSADRQLRRPGRQPAQVPAPTALPEIRTRQQALAWLDAERGNLLTCAAVLCAGPRAEAVIALAAATATYLRDSGPWEHAIALHEAAVAAARQSGDDQARADALRELGSLHRCAGNYPAAIAALDQALDLYQRQNHARGIADTRTELGCVRRWTGDHPGARADLERALAGYEELADRHGQANALNELGVIRHQAHDHRAGVQTQQRALAIYHELADLRGQADVLNQIGVGRQVVSEYLPAIDAYRRALAIYRELGDRHGQARALNYLGCALNKTGEHDAAGRALSEALVLHRKLGYRAGQANALNYLARVRCAGGDYPAAEHDLTEALTLYRDIGYREGAADALNQLGALARLGGDYRSAAASHREALAIARQLGDPLVQAEALNQLGRLLLVENQPSQALDHHQRALQLAGAAHNPHEEARSLAGIGRCALRLGDRDRAAETLGRARDIYRRIGLGQERDVLHRPEPAEPGGQPSEVD